MIGKKKFLFVFILLLSGAFSAEILSLSPLPGKAAVIGASQSDMLPAKSPKFTLQIFPDCFEVVIDTPLLPGESPKIRGTKNDDESMFIGDIAEFFISTSPAVYYQIAVNPAGLIYSAKGRDNTWTPRIKTQVQQKKDSWTARISIPYREINTVKPDKKTVWRANFATKVCSGGIKKSCSWSGAVDFHNIREFGTIRFDNAPLPRVLAWDTQNNHFNAELSVPPKYADHQILCEVDGKNFSGQSSGSLHKFKVPLFGSYIFPKRYCFARISVVAPGGKVIYSRSAKLEPEPAQDLKTDRFYYPPENKELVYKHSFPSGAVLLLKNSAGTPVLRQQAESSGKLSLAGLQPGRYILELVSGNLRTSRLIKIVPAGFSAPAISDSSRFEIKNTLFYLGNQPVFLIGGSGTPKNHLQFSQAFNMNTGNIGMIKNAVSFKGLGHTRFLRQPFSCSFLSPRADKIIAGRMASVPPGNRQVCRLAYEAQLQLARGSSKAPEKINASRYYAELYKNLKKRHPDRYFSIHIDRQEVTDKFINSCDIFEYASWRSSYAPNMMPYLVQEMQELRQKAGKTPVIFWLGGSIPDPYCRMAEELRAAVYCAMICKLNGVIFHLGHGGLGPERSRLWSLISGINAEIQPIYREFASGKEVKDFVKNVKGNFLYSARKCGSKICLAVVNLSGSEQHLEMETAAGNIKFLLTPFEPVYLSFPEN